MNLLKKNLLCTCTALMAAAIFLLPLSAHAAINSLYQESKTEQIAKGLTLTDISRLTDAGWLSFKVLDADLNEPTLESKLMIGTHLTDKTKLSDLATNSGAVAAINCDYFNFGRNTMIGPVVQDGSFIASQVPGKSLNAFSLTNDNILKIGNWVFSGTLTAPDGSTMLIDSYNKASNVKLGMFDSHFDAMSPQDIFKVKHITEIVVVNGIAQDVRTSMSGISIPADGYILCGINAGSDFLSSKFKIGDPVLTSITTVPDPTFIKLAAGCGAILAQNSQPLSFVDTTPGTFARSGLGYNSQNKHMYLSVVDAKNADSIGLTQPELAQFLLSLGVDTVLNLDGGGSSEMVARRLGESSTTVLNTPSDGKERPIAEGIGFVTNAPTTTLAGIKIAAFTDKILQGSTQRFSVLGYDGNFNPISVDPAAVQWSVNNSIGSFTDSVFNASQHGRGSITANVSGITTTLPLRVTGLPMGIECDKDRISLAPGSTYSFTVYAVDNDGYRTQLPSGSYNVSVIGAIGMLSGNTLTAAASPASGAVEFDYGNFKCRLLVNIGSNNNILSSFDTATGASFLASPAKVTGGNVTAESNPLYVHSGARSLKLAFNFSKTAPDRAAFLVFPNKTEPLGVNVKSFGIWVYGDYAQGRWLRARVVNAAGTAYFIDLSKKIDWTGWKFVTAQLPAAGNYYLSRISVAANSAAPIGSGYVYLDDLSTTGGTSTYNNSLLLPQVSDSDNQVTSSGVLNFAVIGDLGISPAYSADKQSYLRKVAQSLSKSNAQMLVIAGKTGVNGTAVNPALIRKYFPLTIPSVDCGGAPRSIEMQGAHLIFLNDSNGSITKSNASQWTWLQNDLQQTNDKNIFVVMPERLSNFTNKKDAELFTQLLNGKMTSSSCQIWVLSSSPDVLSSSKLDGIKLLATPGANMTKPVNGGIPHYLRISVNNGVAVYQVVNIL